MNQIHPVDIFFDNYFQEIFNDFTDNNYSHSSEFIQKRMNKINDFFYISTEYPIIRNDKFYEPIANYNLFFASIVSHAHVRFKHDIDNRKLGTLNFKNIFKQILDTIIIPYFKYYPERFDLFIHFIN